jgi:hypothetical protein
MIKIKTSVKKRLHLAILGATALTVSTVGRTIAGPFDEAQKSTASQFSAFSTDAGVTKFDKQIWAIFFIFAIVSILWKVGGSWAETRSMDLELSERIQQIIKASLPIIVAVLFAAALIAWLVGTNGGGAGAGAG